MSHENNLSQVKRVEISGRVGLNSTRINGLFLLLDEKINNRPTFKRVTKDGEEIILWHYDKRGLWMISGSEHIGTDNAFGACKHAAMNPYEIEYGTTWFIYNSEEQGFIRDTSIQIVPYTNAFRETERKQLQEAFEVTPTNVQSCIGLSNLLQNDYYRQYALAQKYLDEGLLFSDSKKLRQAYKNLLSDHFGNSELNILLSKNWEDIFDFQEYLSVHNISREESTSANVEIRENCDEYFVNWNILTPGWQAYLQRNHEDIITELNRHSIILVDYLDVYLGRSWFGDPENDIILKTIYSFVINYRADDYYSPIPPFKPFDIVEVIKECSSSNKILPAGSKLKVICVLDESRCNTAIEVEMLQQDDEASDDEDDFILIQYWSGTIHKDKFKNLRIVSTETY